MWASRPGGSFEQANISADRTSYTLIPASSFPYGVTSMAGDVDDGDAVPISTRRPRRCENFYYRPVQAVQTILLAEE